MAGKGFTINERSKEPKISVDQKPAFGFTEYAETLNGRLAMIGFVSLVALEVFTGHSLIDWLTSL